MTSLTLITKTYQAPTGPMQFTFREDGWFNMTKAAKAFGKLLHNFWTSPSTKEYVDELATALSLDSRDCRPYEAHRGGNHMGTWAHPKLAVFFARWLDVRFAVWCDMAIDDILRGKAELVITKPEESAAMQLPKDYSAALRALADSFDQQEKLRVQNEVLAPKAAVFDAVVADRQLSLYAFARNLPGVNAHRVKHDLLLCNYLYLKSGKYYVYSEYRGDLFVEKLNTAYGSREIYPTEKGKQLLVTLHKAGKLSRRKT